VLEAIARCMLLVVVEEKEKKSKSMCLVNQK
jgi:hypothetical protein